MMTGLLKKRLRQNAVYYLVAILIALALKQYYSLARPEDLTWILKPTAGLVSLVKGDTFVFEPGIGYVCNARSVIIAPACAGVNFMLMAFGMAVFAGLCHMRTIRHRLAWILFSLSASYMLTLGVNGLRIMVSIYTFNAGMFNADFSWEQVHRLEGVVIYFFFQYLFYSMIQKIIGTYTADDTGQYAGTRAVFTGRRPPIRKTVIKGLTPCAWYLAVTLAVPFLNSAAGKYGNRFYDHAAMVLSFCLATWTCLVVVELCGQGMRLFLAGGLQNHETQNPDR